MNIIFLDVDGVLNNELFYTRKRIKHEEQSEGIHEYRKRQFDPRCIGLLNAITDDNKAKIVLSSTWRKTRGGINYLKKLFEEVGITGELVGLTPTYYIEELKSSVPRGVEIYGWLNNTKLKIGNYVIIDDDSDMLLWQKEHYFHVDAYSGLTKNVAYKIKRYFNREI